MDRAPPFSTSSDSALELFSTVKQLLPPLSPFRSSCWALVLSSDGSSAFCGNKCGDEGALCVDHSSNLSSSARGALRLAATLGLRLIEIHHAYLEARHLADILSSPEYSSSTPANVLQTSSIEQRSPRSPDHAGDIRNEAAALRRQMAALQLERSRGSSEAAGLALSVLRDSERAIEQAHAAAQEEVDELREDLQCARAALDAAQHRIRRLEESGPSGALEMPRGRSARLGRGGKGSLDVSPASDSDEEGASSVLRLLQLSPVASVRAEQDSVRLACAGGRTGTAIASPCPDTPPAHGTPYGMRRPLSTPPSPSPLAMQSRAQAGRDMSGLSPGGAVRPGIPLETHTSTCGPPDIVRSPRSKLGLSPHLSGAVADKIGVGTEISARLSLPVAAAVDANAAASARVEEAARVGVELARFSSLRFRLDALQSASAYLSGNTVVGHRENMPIGGTTGNEDGSGGGASVGAVSSPSPASAGNPLPRRLTLRLGSSPLARQVAEALRAGQGHESKTGNPGHDMPLNMAMLHLSFGGDGGVDA